MIESWNTVLSNKKSKDAIVLNQERKYLDFSFGTEENSTSTDIFWFSKEKHPLANFECIKTEKGTYCRCFKGVVIQTYDHNLASTETDVVTALKQMYSVDDFAFEYGDANSFRMRSNCKFVRAIDIGKIRKKTCEIVVDGSTVYKLCYSDKTAAKSDSIFRVFASKKKYYTKYWILDDGSDIFCGEEVPAGLVQDLKTIGSTQRWDSFYAMSRNDLSPEQAPRLKLVTLSDKNGRKECILAKPCPLNRYLGCIFSLRIPRSVRDIEPGWLTSAMHAAGSLSVHSKVKSISVNWVRPHLTASHAYVAGFSAKYEHKSKENFPRPPERLVVKIGGGVGHVEVAVGLYFRSQLPVVTPVCVFGDIADGTAIIISEEAIFELPHIDKCFDHTLGKDDCMQRYRRILESLARLNTIDIVQHIDKIPNKVHRELVRVKMLQRDRHHLHFADNAHEVSDEFYLKHLRSTITFLKDQVPQLFQIEGFNFDQIESVTMTLWQGKESLEQFLLSPDHDEYISFCHGNLNLDNCYFWRDKSNGRLEVGFLDWDTARVENLAWSLMYSLLSALPFLHDQEDELIEFYLKNIETVGGPRLDRQRFMEMYSVSVAFLWLTMAQMGRFFYNYVDEQTLSSLTNSDWKRHPKINTWCLFNLHVMQMCASDWTRIEYVASNISKW